MERGKLGSFSLLRAHAAVLRHHCHGACASFHLPAYHPSHLRTTDPPVQLATQVAVAHALSEEYQDATLDAEADEIVKRELGRRAAKKPPKDFLVADGLKHGKFKGAPGSENVPPIVMANISMLQMEELIPNLHEIGELRFERIEEELSAVENKVDELLGKKYEVHE